MKFTNNKDPVFKRSSVVVSICLLLAILLSSGLAAQAQSPLLKQKFSLHPYSEWGSGYVMTPNLGQNSPVTGPGGQAISPAPVPQYVPSNGGATTELRVNQSGDVSFISVSFDYASSVVQVQGVRPGSIFNNLTEGVDYLIQTRLNRATPFNPAQEMVLPSLVTPLGVQVDHRSYVDIMIINPTQEILYQSGSLIKIDWAVSNTALANRSPLIFSRIDMKDSSGFSVAPCMGAPNPSDVPNLLGLPGPNPGDPNPCYDATQQSQRFFGTGDGPIIGFLEVVNEKVGMTFQVSFQGLSNVDSTAIINKFSQLEIEATTNGGDVMGDVLSPLDGMAQILAPPPYLDMTISRPGYLTAVGSDISGPLLDTGVILVAGDVDGSGVVDIIDLSLMSSNLNAPVGNNVTLEKMDYNGDGRVDVIDVAIAAGNFRTYGPTTIR